MSVSAWYGTDMRSAEEDTGLPSGSWSSPMFRHNGNYYAMFRESGKLIIRDCVSFVAVYTEDMSAVFSNPDCWSPMVFAKGYVWFLGWNTSTSKISLKRIDPDLWESETIQDLTTASSGGFFHVSMDYDGDDVLCFCWMRRGLGSGTAYIGKYEIDSSTYTDIGNVSSSYMLGVAINSEEGRIYSQVGSGRTSWPIGGGSPTLIAATSGYVGALGYHLSHSEVLSKPDDSDSWTFPAETVLDLTLLSWHEDPILVHGAFYEGSSVWSYRWYELHSGSSLVLKRSESIPDALSTRCRRVEFPDFDWSRVSNVRDFARRCTTPDHLTIELRGYRGLV